MELAHPTLAGVFFGAAAGAWFAYFRLKERVSKPFGLMLAALLGGHVSGLLAVLAFDQLDAWGLVADWCLLEQSWRRALPATLMIAGVEEGAKLLPTLVVGLAGRRHLRSSRDAIFISALVGVGFAVVENVVLCQQGMSVRDSLARAVASPVTHALFAAPAGLGVGRMLLWRRWFALPVGLVTSITAHGAYNLLLARQVPQAIPAMIVLALWVWLLIRLNGKQPALVTIRAG